MSNMRIRKNISKNKRVIYVYNGLSNYDEEKKTKEFLFTVYEQCCSVYVTFVNARFQILSLFISNAALFYFLYTQETKLPILVVFVSFVAIFLTWTIFFIDLRNKYIFRRAAKIASKIEAFLDVPFEMQLFTKTPADLKKKISHSALFFVLTVSFTVFWGLFIFFWQCFII
jgi:hypothetical protein